MSKPENHATVKLGDYTVPLIGIPKSATEQKCDSCGKVWHLREVKLWNGKFLCHECRPTEK